jgi:hypothetical protein
LTQNVNTPFFNQFIDYFFTNMATSSTGHAIQLHELELPQLQAVKQQLEDASIE